MTTTSYENRKKYLQQLKSISTDRDPNLPPDMDESLMDFERPERLPRTGDFDSNQKTTPDILPRNHPRMGVQRPEGATKKGWSYDLSTGVLRPVFTEQEVDYLQDADNNFVRKRR